MARSYSTKLVALTLSVQPKWLDNLLTRVRLPGVERARQGVERRISDDGVLAVAVTRLLIAELALPMERAAALATAAVESSSAPSFRHVTPSGVALDIPIASLRERLRQALGDAIQSVPDTPRGRPRRTVVSRSERR